VDNQWSMVMVDLTTILYQIIHQPDHYRVAIQGFSASTLPVSEFPSPGHENQDTSHRNGIRDLVLSLQVRFGIPFVNVLVFGQLETSLLEHNL